MPENTGAFFDPSVGYRGIVKLDDVILLATGGNVNLAHNPIFSQGIWGAGYQNASDQVAYANNYLQLDGSMGCEMTAGKGFEAVKTFAFTNRGSQEGTRIAILPTGEQGFVGKGWCTQLSFTCSQDAVLTCDMSWSSFVNALYTGASPVDPDGTIDYTKNIIVTGTPQNSALGTSNGVLPMAYNGLYPYWANELYGGESGTQLSDIMNWTASYSSSVEYLKCCGKGTALQDTNPDLTAPLSPDYIVLGSMSAEGSYTVFKLQGDFDPDKYHNQKMLKIVVKSPADTTGHTILLPKIVNSSGSTQIQSGSSFITADFSFTAIGDGKNPPLSLDPEPDQEEETGGGMEEP